MERVWGNEFRTTMICVDAYQNGELSGRFYNPIRPEGTAFQNLTQLLIGMEDMLDGMQLPQSFTAVRAFSSGPDRTGGTPAEERIQTGQKATFAVRVLFRQNASWQGSVAWLEGKKEENFRSVLELIFLMNSALQEG